MKSQKYQNCRIKESVTQKREKVFFKWKNRMCSSQFLLFAASLFWTFVLDHCFLWFFSRINVLLSHITNLKDLYLVGNYTSNAIKTNMDASQEYDRLKKYCPFIPDLGLTRKKSWSVNHMVKYSISLEACHWYLRRWIFPHWYFIFCIQKHILRGENILDILLIKLIYHITIPLISTKIFSVVLYWLSHLIESWERIGRFSCCR